MAVKLVLQTVLGCQNDCLFSLLSLGINWDHYILSLSWCNPLLIEFKNRVFHGFRSRSSIARTTWTSEARDWTWDCFHGNLMLCHWLHSLGTRGNPLIMKRPLPSPGVAQLCGFHYPHRDWQFGTGCNNHFSPSKTSVYLQGTFIFQADLILYLIKLEVLLN